MRDYPECIVSLNDSQLLRFIDELNDTTDSDVRAREIKYKLRQEKKKPRSKETKRVVTELYQRLYNLQYQRDYICIIMDRDSDYDRANLGFSVNGIKYRRFLGTNGGIKHSTIVYVSERLYPELKKRLDNGRNKDKPVVPAKLEAYQALICSGSTPISEPDGIIVVDDCITNFLENIIMINDEADGEPDLQYIDNYQIEHNDSDGYGLMLPSYSKRVNFELTGEVGKTISGMNTRYAWTKGMVYTFDFVEFAKNVAGRYEVVDAWGDVRDVRRAEVILTTSMLKLWDSYDSWEDFYRNCRENHYQFSTPKITPSELEHVRNTNYQFLQSYDFTDDELQELCQPTIDEIKDVLGMDYRKSLVFLAGFGLNQQNAFSDNVAYPIKALMANPKLINDTFIRKTIVNMLKNRIIKAKKGAVKINANFAMISGDPYALCQSMFKMEITGLLKRGEVYHKYWIDKGAKEIACFRAPMTCHNNIRKLTLCNREEVAYWYQYITTAVVLNAWDTTCDAMNGADKDGDTFMCTDNPLLVRKIQNLPTIICAQRKAEKIVPTEEDIIKANKLAFNDDIGVVTNHITSMFERQAGYEKGSKEYDTLSYRIMCGQLYQQNTIDRAKGIIAKPMPKYWYDRKSNLPDNEDDPVTATKKAFNLSIVSDKKPYFMTYVYPDLKKDYSDFDKNTNSKALRLSKCGIDELKDKPYRTQEEDELLKHHRRLLPVGTNACVVNRLCWIIEKEFSKNIKEIIPDHEFDYSILKSGAKYSKEIYYKILEIYKEYTKRAKSFKIRVQKERLDSFDAMLEHQRMINFFCAKCEQVCTNEKELCDIVLDICYSTENSKQFAWDVCGEIIVENLLEKSGGVIRYPEKVDSNEEFEYFGLFFTMKEKVIVEADDCTE